MTHAHVLPTPMVFAAGLLPLLLLGACAGGGREAAPAIAGTEVPREAQRLFAELEQESRQHHDARVLELGVRLFANYPDHANGDAAMAMMIEAALRLPTLDRARDLAIAFPARFPASPRRDALLQEVARTLTTAGRPADALSVLAALADAADDPAVRGSVAQAAAVTVAGLDDAALRTVERRLAGSSLASVVAAELATRNLARTIVPAVAVRRGRIGVIGPLTGRYARFGNAMQAGVRLAAAAVPPAPGDAPGTIVNDATEGDPVTAALAARRLCADEGCQLLIGALLSTTTATVALVAERYGVPLVSPTATNARLGELGPHVLQTNLSGGLEAEVLARLATEVLLKRRFAIIRPDTPEGASLAAAFAAAVIRRGARLVGEEVFDPTTTDFQIPVQNLRALRPEVVFAPTTADQIVLLGPQLDFYRVGALLLGPSDWNNTRLLQRAGSVMEGALCAAAEVTYPAAWSVDFASRWPADQYDEESTRLARGAYLAARLALETLAATRPVDQDQLITALRERLTARGLAVSGPESYAASVRLIRDRDLVAFPAELYGEAWRRQAAAGAAADSLARSADQDQPAPPVTPEGR